MRARLSALSALMVLATAVPPASAQDGRTVEVTPYIGLGTAAAPVGTAVTLPVTSTLSVETDVAYRRGEGDRRALSTSASVLYSLPPLGHSTPYVVAGMGLAEFGKPVVAPDGRIGTLPGLTTTVNAGGGLKTAMTERLNLRTDARWFKSFGRYGSEQFRVAQGIGFDAGTR